MLPPSSRQLQPLEGSRYIHLHLRYKAQVPRHLKREASCMHARRGARTHLEKPQEANGQGM